MRILLVHNFYQQWGGEDAVYLAERDLLIEHGHDVVEWTVDSNSLTNAGSIGLGLEAIWSRRAFRELRDASLRFHPDVVHFHNTFPLVSPSAYYAVRDAGFPVVQTLHNYRLSCPNIVFSRDGRACTECLGRFFAWPGIRHGCFHGSRVATGAVATVQSIHRATGTWRHAVDLYITPTNFARDMAIRAGVPPAKIRVKPHFVSPDPEPGDHSGGFALFVGRLSGEKGLSTLLDAWKMIAARIPLRIVGDGPERQLAADAAEHMAGVEWLGQRDALEVSRLMGEAALLICPSTAYETFGRVVVEAYARGTPVIGSAHGALQEIIAVGETGYLFAPGSAESLAAVVDEAWAHQNDLMRMSTACRRHFLDYYSAAANHERLLDIYREAQG